MWNLKLMVVMVGVVVILTAQKPLVLINYSLTESFIAH
jgi:hypothetical protein